MRKRQAIALIAALALMGCAEMGMGVPGTSRSSGASEATLVTATATVAAVDQSTRQVQLVDDADGTPFTVTAGPEVRNLEQVTAGDRVELDFYQSTAVSMADPADTGEVATADLAVRTPEGALPGGLAATTTSLVVTLISYDRDTGLATFRTPDGLTRRTVVPPQLRNFAASRAPGARVLVTLTDALAVSVTEMPAS
jgi:hypothetical protein